jgi:hypothetical protein
MFVEFGGKGEHEGIRFNPHYLTVSLKTQLPLTTQNIVVAF